MVSTSSIAASTATRPFAKRAAFLLNANARAVDPRLVARLAEVVPAGDLFLSRTLEDAEVFARTIARRGYGQLFTGGGDGTLVSAIAYVKKACEEQGLPMPAVGVLKLGTGNAMAVALRAGDAVVDAFHVVQRGESTVRPVHFIETEDGTLTPFAGMGYDGQVLNDYTALKKAASSSPIARRLVESVAGYLGATLLKSIPQQIRAPAPRVKVTSQSDAFAIMSTADGDVEVRIPAGTVLFEGAAPIISVGTIPFFGYGFTMFPFVEKKPGYMQLRVGRIPLPVILANLWPRIWNGTFRYDQLKDILVKDVAIESDRELPYQVGGDAAGTRKKIAFRVSEEPVQMIELGARLVPAGSTVVQLGPLRTVLRLPR